MSDYEPKRFTKFKVGPNGTRSFQESDWRQYWDGLSDDEKESLKSKARSERVSLSSVAIDCRAIVPEEQCMDCGALGLHSCGGVPGGFPEDDE